MENIFQRLTHTNYEFDPIKNLFFENYMTNVNKYNIIYGSDCYDGKIYDNYKNILIDFEEPNFAFKYNDVNVSFVKTVQKKLTLCPYFAALYNSTANRTIAEQCFFPVDIEYIVKHIGKPSFNKSVNVLYIGNTVSNFVHKLKELSANIDIPTYLDKIQALYNTKISKN